MSINILVLILTNRKDAVTHVDIGGWISKNNPNEILNKTKWYEAF